MLIGGRRRSMPRMEVGQSRGTTIPSKVTGAPIYQTGSGDSEKATSWLSDDVRGIFTINTDAGELASVLYKLTSSEASSPIPIPIFVSLCTTRTCRGWLLV